MGEKKLLFPAYYNTEHLVFVFLFVFQELRKTKKRTKYTHEAQKNK
jgi:hypothetical protein